MGSKSRHSSQLHIFFFPLMAQGHMIPTIDVAKLFASSGGVKSTIITTPLNANLISKSIQASKQLGLEIDTLIINFPCKEAGLPEGCENLDMVSPNEIHKFYLATSLLQDPLEQLLKHHRPDCLAADMFFPWATDAAAKFNIPRLVFHGISLFALCCTESVRLYQPQKRVSSETEEFVIPNIPDEIKLTRNKIFVYKGDVETGFTLLLNQAKESELKSYGVIVNSFNELEPAYAEHYRKVLGRKAWIVGPVSLCNKGTEAKGLRGKEASIDEFGCLKWLDLKKPNSVVYVCFGTTAHFPASQLREIAVGLEACGQEFIWVVRKSKEEDINEEKWLPDGFEKRMQGKGLIIQGWAPQLLILDHKSVGGFVTHCGWNSTLEGVAAGMPMVTWPVFAEQFYNEKLLTEVLKIGVGVGVQQWARAAKDDVKSEAVATAVKRVMGGGEEAEEMRSRAKRFGELARMAVEEGGSSYRDLNALIEELRLHDRTSTKTT